MTGTSINIYLTKGLRSYTFVKALKKATRLETVGTDLRYRSELNQRSTLTTGAYALMRILLKSYISRRQGGRRRERVDRFNYE